MPGVNIQTLLVDIGVAASNVVNKDISTVQGFSQDQLQAIAQQSVLIAGGITDGSIGPATRDFFLQSLQEMVGSFANVLAGLAVIEVEKVLNAITGVIWGAINQATGLNLIPP